MLSILIPTYNYKVTPLIESLSKQLENVNFSYEILVIDDCSSNAEIIESNKSIENFPHCTFIQNLINKGRTATRQALAETAKYNLLLFMDADVLPGNSDFIKNFDIENQSADVVFGGIAYESKKPDKEKMLRWKYGSAREARPVAEREKMPYLSIISGCVLIKKNTFLSANIMIDNLYGSDVVFCMELQKMEATVKHIENPVLHLGLENNASFIEKTKKGLESLYRFEKEGIITDDYRPIQKAHAHLRKWGLNSFYILIFRYIEKTVLKNLKSKNPSLLAFNLWKLFYFSKLKH